MSIEGLGKQFQDARLSRGLSLEQAARETKIKQSRLSELEADDYSNFPSLAYAKGFLQIYGKFLGIDTGPYLDHFETSEHITVDGYSYLQENPAPKPTRTSVTPRAAAPRSSLMLPVLALIVLFAGLWFIRLVLNVQRISPRPTTADATNVSTPVVTATPMIAAPRAQPVETPALAAASAPASPPQMTVAPTTAQLSAVAVSTPPPLSTATPAAAAAPSAAEPEVRRAQPVSAAELAAVRSSSTVPTSESGPNRVDIRPLKKTYMQVTVDDDPSHPAFERWVSPSDGVVEFRGHRFSVRVLDREAVQIRKNGKLVSAGDADLNIE